MTAIVSSRSRTARVKLGPGAPRATRVGSPGLPCYRQHPDEGPSVSSASARPLKSGGLTPHVDVANGRIATVDRTAGRGRIAGVQGRPGKAWSPLGARIDQGSVSVGNLAFAGGPSGQSFKWRNLPCPSDPDQTLRLNLPCGRAETDPSITSVRNCSPGLLQPHLTSLPFTEALDGKKYCSPRVEGDVTKDKAPENGQSIEIPRRDRTISSAPGSRHNHAQLIQSRTLIASKGRSPIDHRFSYGAGYRFRRPFGATSRS
jgi:hypothetical protein